MSGERARGQGRLAIVPPHQCVTFVFSFILFFQYATFYQCVSIFMKVEPF